MEKGYVILSGSVDGATCDDDGFVNCANFALASKVVHKTLEEAKEIRRQIMETDLADFQELWSEEDGYSIEQGDMNDYDGRITDTYIDVYYNGDITNETIYKIEEIEY